MQKVIFFLRHNNDLDHITPVLYKWITTKQIPIDIIITSDESLLEDYRIKYLKDISKTYANIHIYHINDFFAGHFWHWFNNFYSRNSTKLDSYDFIRNRINSVVKQLFYNLFNFEDGNQYLVCFDWNSNYFIKFFTALCHVNHIPVVALPHGDEPYFNQLQKDSDVNFAQSLTPYTKRKIFDTVVVPNQLCADHYEFMSDKIEVLGSPRYCDEWIPINDSIKPKVPYISQPGNTLKIVLFLRNKHWPINWPEMINIIKLITQFDRTYLIVKNHARGNETYDITWRHPELNSLKNMYIDSSLNASSLIDWADLVIDVGTSTCWEAIKKDKPILMLDYVCGNNPTISHYAPKTSITCRDDLFDHIRKFIKNPKRQLISEYQKHKFIKEIIGTENILENYCNFLEKTLNDKPKTEVKEKSTVDRLVDNDWGPDSRRDNVPPL